VADQKRHHHIAGGWRDSHKSSQVHIVTGIFRLRYALMGLCVAAEDLCAERL
jgi:hypothetical protein